MIACVFSVVSAAGFSPVGKWQTVDDKSGKPKSSPLVEANLIEGFIAYDASRFVSTNIIHQISAIHNHNNHLDA